MDGKVDFALLVPADQTQGDSDKDTVLLKAMHQEATKYIGSFPWCKKVKEEYFGIGVGKVFAIFLFRIEPANPKVDEWLWVVVGDLPSAYLVTDNAPNPACALDVYICEMGRWVTAVKEGKSVVGLIPVNVAPSLEHAKMLESRLSFLDRKILSEYKDDLLKED